MLTDGESLVALWRRWERHDHEVFFGKEAQTIYGNRDLIFDRLFNIMHQRHSLSKMLESFPRPIIPELFWFVRTNAEIAPEVEFFLDLADVLTSPTTQQGG